MKKLFYASMVLFTVVIACCTCYYVGYYKGRVKGFNDGVDFGTIEIQNLMGWDAPKAESIQEYENMIKKQRK